MKMIEKEQRRMRQRMVRIVLGLMVLFQISVCAQEKPGENDGLQEQVRNLGAKSSRDRATASKLLTARIKVIDEKISKHLKNNSQKNQDGAAEKNAKKAMEELRRFYKHLESAKASAEDPEIRIRLDAVLKSGRFSSAFFKLSQPAQQLAVIPFDTGFRENGNAVSRKTYGRNGFGITDLGNIRIVLEGVSISGESTSSSVYIRPFGGSSSSSSGSGARQFNFQSRQGVTAIQWGLTLEFTITDGVLVIDGHSVEYSDTPKVIFLSKKNKVTAVIRVGSAVK